MPSQRPFFASLFSAFRAHSAFKSAAATNPAPPATSSSGSASGLASQTTQASTAAAAPSSGSSAARGISTAAKPPTSPLSAAAAAAFSPPASRHPGSPPTGSTPLPISRQQNASFASGRRRGSESSSDGGSGSIGSLGSTGSGAGGGGGFRDALGGEKWFIGGRTAAGEERFYRLAMVRRERSGDRASLDRMSL